MLALAATVVPGAHPARGGDSFGAASHAAHAGGAAMRPVPRFVGTPVRDPSRTRASAANSQGLQWRTSSEVAPPAAAQVPAPASAVAPAATAAAATAAAATAVMHSGLTQAAPVDLSSQAPAQQTAAAAVTSAADPRGVRHAQFEDVFAQQPLPSPQTQQLPQPQPLPNAPQLPSTIQPELQAPQAQQRTPPATGVPLPDFFDDPTPGLPETQQTPLLPPPMQVPQLENGLRESQQQPVEPVPLFPDAEPSPFELRPMPMPGVEGLQQREIEDFEMPRRDGRQRGAPVAPEDDMTLIRPAAFSCDDFRRSIAEAKIQTLSLDISPPFRPDVIELDEFRHLKERFDERQEIRDWHSVDGRRLGRGRMRDLAYEKVIIETEFGTTEELPVNRISEADLAYVSSQWGLPQECLIAQPQYQERAWTASQITWKASNLVHKPLYFEEVNLERYGHTAGPFLQPVVSSAHFFANIAVLPYKMGVHSPHECQYALGYYRPGNCAPWITPPVPLSLRGALYQAAAMTGQGLLFP